MDVIVWDSARTLCEPGWWGSGVGFHECWHKLYLVRQGAAVYGISRDASDPPMATLAPGRIHLIPGGCRHRHACPAPILLDWCHFNLADPDLDLRMAQLDGILSWSLDEVLPRPAQESAISGASHSPAGRLLAAGLVLHLLSRLAEPPTPAASDLRQRLKPALDWMNYHFRGPLGIDDLARRCGLKPARFQQLFRQLHGTSVYDHILTLRMEEAQRLLASTPATIRAVAEAVGYASPFHFTRAFTKRLGSSPSAWRAGTRSGMTGIERPRHRPDQGGV